MAGRVRQGIERPEQRAAAGVESPDDTSLHARGPGVADRGADDYNIQVDGRWRSDEIVSLVPKSHPRREIDLAIGAKVVARAPRCGIVSYQARIQGAGEYSPDTCALVFNVRILPQAHSPGGHLPVGQRPVDMRVEAPPMYAGFGVEGDDDDRGGLEVEQAESQHRSDFKGYFAGVCETRAVLSCPKSPGDREVRDVLSVDLIEAGEALAEHVTAVVAPIAGIRRLRERGLIHDAGGPHRRGD